MNGLRWMCFGLAALAVGGCGDDKLDGVPADGGGGGTTSSSSGGRGGGGGADAGDAASPPWLDKAHIFVSGEGVTNTDCRTAICTHNENVDAFTYKGASYLVHRTAKSQVLGPDCALHIYRSTDGTETWKETAMLPALPTRDLRDPHFYENNGVLFIEALTRLPVVSTRDSNVDTVAVVTHTTDGEHWTALEPVAPETWSFWRVKENKGTLYSAAYEDGDKSVVLFTSQDGLTWSKGPLVYGVSADTPLETELQFMPKGKLLALVRMDGSNDELLGDKGRLRTKICWASPPAYDSFACDAEFDGERLDGPVSFFHGDRLFVIARKHLQPTQKKRTALFEITGDFDGGALAIKDWGTIPSAGDTAYAGQVTIDADRTFISWYSGNLKLDEDWWRGILDTTDIWTGVIDFSKLK